MPIQRYLTKAELELESKKLNVRKPEAQKENLLESDRRRTRVIFVTLVTYALDTLLATVHEKCLSVEEKLHPGELNTKQLRSSIFSN